jgi:hypothetical protein
MRLARAFNLSLESRRFYPSHPPKQYYKLHSGGITGAFRRIRAFQRKYCAPLSKNTASFFKQALLMMVSRVMGQKMVFHQALD